MQVFARLAFETVVTIRYLIRHFSRELADAYVAHSLKHERKLLDTILDNIRHRGGAVLPIEDRMIKSITRAEAAAGMSLSDIDPRDNKPWGGKSLYAKAEDVRLGPAYLAFSGGGSHSIHGSWQEIYSNHLEWDGEGFSPKLDWTTPKPQRLWSLRRITVEAIGECFDFIGIDGDLDRSGVPLDNPAERLMIFCEAHEEYLKGKTWPEV